MEKDAFHPESEHFDLKWTAPKRPEVHEERMKELLSNYVKVSEEFHLPFVRVLGRLSQEAETWNMLNLAVLEQYDPGLKRFKHFFYKHWIRVVKLTVTERVPLEPEPLLVVQKSDRGWVIGMVAIGVDFPAVFGENLRNSVSLNDLGPCLREGRQQPMSEVKHTLRALAAWDINWEDKAKALETFKACEERLHRTVTVCWIPQIAVF